MRDVKEIPIELLIAIESDAVERVTITDGEIVRVGRWVVLREFEDTDCGRIVSDMRAFRFASAEDADETLWTMLEETLS